MAAASLLRILRTIREHGSVSRTTLQQVTNLSWGTITNSTRDLLNRNLLREENVPSARAGRKPVHLSINRADQFLVGLEIAADTLQCLAIDLAGATLWESAATPADEPDSALDAGADLIRRAVLANAPRTCIGIGVALPGTLDATPEILMNFPQRPAWNNLPVRAGLQSRLNSPIRLERSTHCLALAERWFGEAGHVQDMLCVVLDETVGMGIILNGDIFRGSQGAAGEFGRMVLDPPDPTGPHGGCVESVCALPALRTQTHQAARAEGRDLSHIRTLPHLIQHAQAGDPVVQAVFQRMGRYLGIAVANAMDLFNPELVLLAGRTTAAWPYFFPALLREIESHAGPQAGRNVVVSKIQGHPTAMGACAMILESSFSRLPEAAPFQKNP